VGLTTAINITIRISNMSKLITSASDVLSQSQEGKIANAERIKAAGLLGATAASISALRTINLPPAGNPVAALASNAINGLSGVALGAAVFNTSPVPTAANMRSAANSAEKAAQAEIDKIIYETYKTSIFDPIVSLAQAGTYTYNVKLDTAQQNQLRPLLIKNGYKLTDIADSDRYNLTISWI
jgi:hypothetical protein